MDIYSAEIQVQKLLDYVQKLSDSKPRMYQKSKDRLKELAATCTQVVAVISEILQDETLTEDTEEFGSYSDMSNFKNVLDSMEGHILQLRNFMSSGEVASTNSNVHVKEDVKRIFHDYKAQLELLSHHAHSFVEVDECSRLLWNWFRCRFLNPKSNFRYNIKRFPRWIRSIVILYCYHVEQGDIDIFVNSFNNWIETISNNNTYAVPYEVYVFDKSPDPEMLTLTSVVMWDILLDSGLRNLCKDSSEFYLSEDCIYTLVGSMNSKVMDPYTNYLYDTSILTKCKFTVKLGDTV